MDSQRNDKSPSKRSLPKRITYTVIRYLPLCGLILGVVFILDMERVRSDMVARNQDKVYPNHVPRSFHVANNGDDSRDGLTPETAWLSLRRASRESLLPGDAVLMRGGDTFEGPLILDADDLGTPSRPLLVRSFGNGRATIQGRGSSAIVVRDTAGVEISDLALVGKGNANSNHDGLLVTTKLPGCSRLEHVILEDLTISGFGGCGLRVDSELNWRDFFSMRKGGFRHVRIKGVEARNNLVAGIYVFGIFRADSVIRRDPGYYAHRDIIVRNCVVSDNTGIAGPELDNTGSGIVLSDVDGALIEHSIAFDNGALCNSRQGGPVGIWAWDARDVVIQFNESFDNKTGGTKDGGGFDLDGGVVDSVMQYNYSHDNDGSGFLLAQFPYARSMRNNVVRFNISINDGRKNSTGGILFWTSPDEPKKIESTLVYHNTVVETKGSSPNYAAVTFRQNSVRGVGLYNNILVVNSPGRHVRMYPDQVRVKFRGNAYCSNNGIPLFSRGSDDKIEGFEAWRGVDGVNMEDPAPVKSLDDLALAIPDQTPPILDTRRHEIMQNFRLLPTSTLVDAGLDLRELDIDYGDRDFFGNKFPAGEGFDVGAHELSQQFNQDHSVHQ